MELLQTLPIEILEQVERVETLRAKDFKGPAQELLCAELFDYAFRRLKAKMRTGQIVTLLGDSATPLSMSAEELDTLHSSEADRDELAVRTIAVALRDLQTKAFRVGRWRPEEHPGKGGRPASLETYFFRLCLLVFPRQFRRWRVERTDRFLSAARHLSPDFVRHRLGQDPGSDPGHAVRELCAGVVALLAQEDTRTRAIVTLTLYGCSPSEISGRLKVNLPAVNSVLYRFRSKARKWRRTNRLLLPSEMRALALQKQRQAAR
ncbi:hypothetical protein [Streptomyces globisporus]|uniref:hypothetical protein n=1 Tax=Streptomyces globisporus TaxID=1908 RepID=UPI00382B18DD